MAARQNRTLNPWGELHRVLFLEDLREGGIITWETQQTDYPRTRPDLPNHEPRGCSRGASYSWYIYSANRVKHPLIRSRLLKAWRKERVDKSPVAAWAAIQEDPAKRSDYIKIRGHGGFVRATWEEVNEIIAAANAYTTKKWGPDRVAGFSPIPAMSMISYAAGTRYLSLIGGTCMSFYDWYCDLPPASPQTWGEQTDVPESADWYNAGFLMLWGSNVPQTRTPDAHFYTEARYKAPSPLSCHRITRKRPSSPTFGSTPSRVRMQLWQWLWATSSCVSSTWTGRQNTLRTTAANTLTCLCWSASSKKRRQVHT